MIVAILVVGVVTAQNVVVTNPSWVTPPSPEFLEQPMPMFATLIGVNGDVVLECRTMPRPAAPQNCQVISTTVTGLGFEAKALEVALTGVIAPRAVNGVPQPSRIRFSVRFRAEDWKSAVSRPYLGPTPSQERLRLARAFVDRYGDPPETNPYVSLYPELEPVRRARVQAWVRELFPYDAELESTQTALFLARLVSDADLKTATATGVIPRDPPSDEEAEKASSDFMDARTEALAEQLKARYCAAYDCGVASALPRD